MSAGFSYLFSWNQTSFVGNSLKLFKVFRFLDSFLWLLTDKLWIWFIVHPALIFKSFCINANHHSCGSMSYWDLPKRTTLQVWCYTWHKSACHSLCPSSLEMGKTLCVWLNIRVVQESRPRALKRGIREMRGLGQKFTSHDVSEQRGGR